MKSLDLGFSRIGLTSRAGGACLLSCKSPRWRHSVGGCVWLGSCRWRSPGLSLKWTLPPAERESGPAPEGSAWRAVQLWSAGFEKDFTEDFTEDFMEDFTEDFTKDFTKDFKKIFCSEGHIQRT